MLVTVDVTVVGTYEVVVMVEKVICVVVIPDVAADVVVTGRIADVLDEVVELVEGVLLVVVVMLLVLVVGAVLVTVLAVLVVVVGVELVAAGSALYISKSSTQRRYGENVSLLL